MYVVLRQRLLSLENLWRVHSVVKCSLIQCVSIQLVVFNGAGVALCPPLCVLVTRLVHIRLRTLVFYF